MYILEIILAINLLVLLIFGVFKNNDRKIRLILLSIGFLIFLASLILNQLRWQMIPAYLLFLIMALLHLKHSHYHTALRCIGIALGVLLLGSSVMLSMALPIVKLPAPEGPYVVGSRCFFLVDESRKEAFFGLPDESRELSLRIWYPGLLSNSQPPPKVRTLWQDLYEGPFDLIAFFSTYLSGIKTHTYSDIPLAKAGTPYPILLFSHAYGLFAEQNTLLMEHLASHGYIVIGVNHTRMSLRVVSSQGEVIPMDSLRLKESLTEMDALNDKTLTTLFENTRKDEDRSEYIATKAQSLTEQLAIRVADLRFVMDSIIDPTYGNFSFAELLAHADSKRIGLIGMSFGGSAVIQTCKLDTRCRAGLNLDGPLFGDYQWQSLRVPFLSVLTARMQPYYRSLLLNSSGEYFEVMVEGAKHEDFFDITFLTPSWIGLGGEIASHRVIEILNNVSLQFFQIYLREGSKPSFDTAEFPELHVSRNAQAKKKDKL